MNIILHVFPNTYLIFCVHVHETVHEQQEHEGEAFAPAVSWRHTGSVQGTSSTELKNETEDSIWSWNPDEHSTLELLTHSRLVSNVLQGNTCSTVIANLRNMIIFWQHSPANLGQVDKTDSECGVSKQLGLESRDATGNRLHFARFRFRFYNDELFAHLFTCFSKI